VPEASARQGRAILAIRPERVRLCAEPPPVRLATGEELVAFQSVAEGPAVKVEARVWLTWRTEDVRVVPA
jgi:hypothetical protein